MSFKLKHSGVPALMKTLTAGQENMVQSMRKAGKTEAADKIERGIEKAPVKKYGKEPIKKGPGDKNGKKWKGTMRKDEQGTIIGTNNEKGRSEEISKKENVQKRSRRGGVAFNP